MVLITGLFLLTGHAVYGLVHLVLLRGLKKLKTSEPNSKDSLRGEIAAISVLVSIRNEDKTVADTLVSLEKQNYPKDKLELVLVNDRSSDNTPEILEKFERESTIKTQIVTITSNPPNISPKKYALSQGFSKCTGDIIVSTDADCKFSENWIASLTNNFDEQTGMVVGMTTYYKDANMSPLLWGMQSLEFFSHAVVASSMISNRFPINTNANNMAYRKEAYLETSGLKDYDHVVSGDDDFLLQEMATLDKWKIIYATSPDSQVQTKPSPDLNTIWEQRKRWGSKTTHYGAKQVLFLSFVYLYYLLILLSTLIGVFYSPLFWVGSLSWVLKSWFDYRVVSLASKIFAKEYLLKWFVPTAVVQLILVTVVIPFGTFGTFTWKDNKTKKTVN